MTVYTAALVPGPHRSVRLLSGLLQFPVLAGAAWHVDAGTPTGAGDGLADLSGDGRDALFGAGDAAPVVLEHDGTDYIWLGERSANNILRIAGISAAVGSRVVVTLHADRFPDDAATGLFTAGYRDEGSWSVALNPNGALGSRSWSSPSTAQSVNSPPGAFDRASSWHRFTKAGPDITYESSPDGESWTQRAAWSHDAAHTGAGLNGSCELNLADGQAFGFGGSVYRAAFAQDGVVVAAMDASSATETAVPNTGTAGGEWTLARAASGFKTAVVDRPLLLFGGGQTLTSGALPATGTRLRSARQYPGGPITVETVHDGGPIAHTGLTEEYLGEAVWDRALTGAEIAQASDELRGVPPPTVDRRTYTAVEHAP